MPPPPTRKTIYVSERLQSTLPTSAKAQSHSLPGGVCFLRGDPRRKPGEEEGSTTPATRTAGSLDDQRTKTTQPKRTTPTEVWGGELGDAQKWIGRVRRRECCCRRKRACLSALIRFFPRANTGMVWGSREVPGGAVAFRHRNPLGVWFAMLKHYTEENQVSIQGAETESLPFLMMPWLSPFDREKAARRWEKTREIPSPVFGRKRAIKGIKTRINERKN